MSRLKKITKFKQVEKLKVGDEVILTRPPVVLKVESRWGGKLYLSGESEVWDQEDLDTDLAAGWNYHLVK